MTSKWHVMPGDITEKDNEYTATFSCTNGETGAVTEVAITQQRGGEALDLVGALLSTGELLRQVTCNEKLVPTPIN